jgi:hypothetical protein
VVWWCGVQRVECIVLLMNRLIVRSLPVSDRILFCSTHCLAGPVGLLALENSHELHPCLSIHSIPVSFIDSTKNTNPKIDSYRSIRIGQIQNLIKLLQRFALVLMTDSAGENSAGTL